MKKLIVALVLVFVFSSVCYAGSYTRRRVGNTDYYNDNQGNFGTGRWAGNTYYYHDTQGNYGSGRWIGNTYYYHQTNTDDLD